ncbi:glutamyl-tRNA reductase [Wenzhouxiangella sp. XN79A]|uniref:glutamyl-tRNA reductase n=1 Tax=Wenzhouxiangella sp. XN79A TaxID=2724193 RepID=UPI00144AA1EF|nr:glutamyl-tRNA reductase [Wenzhouxiangella sp. XN79A]NKI34139.1 glutamyl-tRNA reductase [Wenzhouxiangella sp. XN79A]
MSLLALGLSHQTAPVAVRERLAFVPDRLGDALSALNAEIGIDECAIVSTCNRTELYVVGSEASISALADWLHHWHGLAPGTYREELYGYAGNAAVAHLLTVTSGMDSMVLGEPQITGQVKQSWTAARAAGTLGPILDRLFQHAFQTAKHVRTETGIGHNPVTLPFAALKLAHQIHGDVRRLGALMVGAGEMIEDCCRHFAGQGLTRMTIANRSPRRAEKLAAEFAARAIGLDGLPEALHEHDVVVASTASPEPVVTSAMVREALRRRRRQPLFVLDLSVPRNVEPEIGELEDVYLYTIDDLREIAQRGHQKRLEALESAREIVAAQTHAFQRWMNLHGTSATLKQLREQAIDERDRLLERALRDLGAGHDAEDVLRKLGHRLTNRLLHTPSTALRRAAEHGDDPLLEAARRLLIDGDDE